MEYNPVLVSVLGFVYTMDVRSQVWLVPRHQYPASLLATTIPAERKRHLFNQLAALARVLRSVSSGDINV